MDPRQIPFIGNDIYQVGQIYDIVAQPCTPNPTIAVKAAFYYAPTLIWTLLKPEPLDIAFDRASRGHKRIRKGKVKATDFLRLPVPKQGTIGWSVFRAAEIGQRIGWYFLIADATTDWVLNWTSLAYQYSGCQVENADWSAYTGDMPAFVEPFFPAGYQLQGDDHDAGGSGYGSPSLVGLLSVGPYSVTWSGTPQMVPYLGGTPKVTRVWLEITEDGYSTYEIDAEEKTNDDGTTEWQAAHQSWRTATSNVQVIAKVQWTGGFLKMTDQLLQISGGDQGGLLPDP